MIAGAALFMGGFFVAWKLKPPNIIERVKEPIKEPITDETMKKHPRAIRKLDVI